jgi:ParB-like chromosome segregation protein Spo0J
MMLQWKDPETVNPILVSGDLEVVAGHGRLHAAKQIGLTTVPTVVLSSLSPADRKAYVLNDNKLGELAGLDRDILDRTAGLTDLGFDDIEGTI